MVTDGTKSTRSEALSPAKPRTDAAVGPLELEALGRSTVTLGSMRLRLRVGDAAMAESGRGADDHEPGARQEGGGYLFLRGCHDTRLP